ncbi:unnamed protein product [Strongylus vulgaris]|uniref:Uncharacterized protein n=1 Tax=Strongylus vulgaris TaxID=40348 RepID=A0A3P7L530_STRVU|nr:unnamed protein product [Strongylus vulgaris]
MSGDAPIRIPPSEPVFSIDFIRNNPVSQPNDATQAQPQNFLQPQIDFPAFSTISPIVPSTYVPEDLDEDVKSGSSTEWFTSNYIRPNVLKLRPLLNSGVIFDASLRSLFELPCNESSCTEIKEEFVGPFDKNETEYVVTAGYRIDEASTFAVEGEPEIMHGPM